MFSNPARGSGQKNSRMLITLFRPESLPRQKIAKETIWMKLWNCPAVWLTESVPVSRQSGSFLVSVDLIRQFYHMFNR